MQSQSIVLCCLTLASLLLQATGKPSAGCDLSSRMDATSGLKVKLSRHLPTLKRPETSYYGVISLGATRDSEFNVVFDTTYDNLWVQASGYTAGSESTYIRQDRFAFEDDILRGDLYEDSMNVYEGVAKGQICASTPTIKIKNHFYSVDWSQNKRLDTEPFDGVVGLAQRNATGLKESILLALLQPEFERIRREQEPDYPFGPDYALTMGLWINQDLASPLGGELTLGSFDSSKVSYSSLTYHRTTSMKDWQVGVKKVSLFSDTKGLLEVSCPTGCQATLDTGSDYLVGPQADVESILSLVAANYDISLKLWRLNKCQDVDVMPSLVFTFSNPEQEYTITPEQYTSKIINNNTSEEICYLALDAWQSPNWSLGTKFLQAYYTIYDFAHGSVGLAQVKL